MRVALAGKGGAGKTTLSATLARVVAATGRAVVAIDADANPNLSVAMGMTPGSPDLRPLPASLVSRRQGGPGLTEPLEQVLSRHAQPGPDGIQLIGMGAPTHADEGCLCAAHAVVSALLEDLAAPERLVIVDMEASPEHLSRGTVRHADAIILIAEPYYRSLETVRRMARLVAELPVGRSTVVANKIRTDDDAGAIGEFCARHGLELVATVPWSESVGAADRARRALVDAAPTDPVVVAVRELAATLGLVTPRS